MQFDFQHRYIVHSDGAASSVPGAWIPSCTDSLGPRVLSLAQKLAIKLGVAVEYKSDMDQRFYLKSRVFELFNYYRRNEDAFWMPRIPMDWETAVIVIQEHVRFAEEEKFTWFYLQAFRDDRRIRYIADSCGLIPGGNLGRRGPEPLLKSPGSPNWYRHLGSPVTENGCAEGRLV